MKHILLIALVLQMTSVFASSYDELKAFYINATDSIEINQIPLLNTEEHLTCLSIPTPESTSSKLEKIGVIKKVIDLGPVFGKKEYSQLAGPIGLDKTLKYSDELIQDITSNEITSKYSSTSYAYNCKFPSGTTALTVRRNGDYLTYQVQKTTNCHTCISTEQDGDVEICNGYEEHEYIDTRYGYCY